MILSFEVQHSEETLVVTNEVARLLVQGLGDADLVVWQEDLKPFTIDSETGTVVPR